VKPDYAGLMLQKLLSGLCKPEPPGGLTRDAAAILAVFP
jgi:hypothetical protein